MGGAAADAGVDQTIATVPDAAGEGASDASRGDDLPPDAAPLLDAGSELSSTEPGSPSEQFRRIYETILRPSCAQAGFCHGDKPVMTKLLLDTLGGAFANLVKVSTAPSCGSGSGWPATRVVPFDPEASAIMYVKDDVCGYRHATRNQQVDLAPIEAWILAGAR
jgi:hypothetical protein